MSDYTSKLNLYKVDPAIDGEDTFNINTMMNDNWDKIDEKVGNMDEKLSGVEDNANNYNHPDTHDADMIRIKDESGKFTGDNVEDALVEVGSQLADIAYKQGDLTTLQTIEKSDLVGALNEVFQDADNGKTNIYNAIVGKGTTPSGQNFSDLVNGINVISTGYKMAKGTINGLGGTQSITPNQTISLNFRPKLIISSARITGKPFGGMSRYRKSFIIYNEFINFYHTSWRRETSGAYNGEYRYINKIDSYNSVQGGEDASDSVVNMNNDIFTISDNNFIIHPSSFLRLNTGYCYYSIYWVAIGERSANVK